IAKFQCGPTALFPEKSNPPDVSMSGAYCTPTDRRQRRAKKRLKREGTGAEHLGEGVHDPPELEAGQPGSHGDRENLPRQGLGPRAGLLHHPGVVAVAGVVVDGPGVDDARLDTTAAEVRDELGAGCGAR